MLDSVAHDLRPATDLRRTVSAHLEAVVVEEADIVLAIAVGAAYERESEELSVRLDGLEVLVETVDAAHRGRLHLTKNVAAGTLVVDYHATVTGVSPQSTASNLECLEYLRPSRYCESDRLGPLARAEFAGLGKVDLLAGVSSWVGTNIDYVPGSSRPIDGAVATLLSREGVCRDFAHLTAALLRANGVPARIASAYAPGLEPMDFHAVTEGCIDGVWNVVDPTLLAPRASMVRIVTGADASDIAFMTTVRGAVDLNSMEVTAVAMPSLPADDVTAVVQLR